MKKNISINISGIIFHIEEDGYEVLRKYLDSVNRYFASFDDSSEILADIEGRIAELFLSRLNEGKQVITLEDVNSLISTMGSVNDFRAAEEKESGNEGSGPQSQAEPAFKSTWPPKEKKLYRNEKGKILGGVASGIAHYFNVDPVWPRILIVLLTLTTGVLLLVYIILWIALPAAPLEEQPAVKKMYRDPDRKVLGGVASGISAFFGADLVLVRILFLVMAFFGGIGFLLYIVLWMVLPEAKTLTEKMEMQGEPVTLSNIESNAKKNRQDGGEEESTVSRILLFPFKVIGTIFTALGPVLQMIVEIFRVFVGIVITFTGLALALSLLFTAGILLGIFGMPDWGIFSDWHWTNTTIPMEAIRNSFPGWGVVFGFLAVFIPVVFILLLGVSVIAKRIVFNGTVGWALFVTFFISVIVAAISLPGAIFQFKEEGENRVEQLFALDNHTPVFRIHETGMDDYEVTSIWLKPGEGKEIKLVKRFQAQGATKRDGIENAKMVDYLVSQRDSVIYFDSNLTFKKDAKFRAQRLDVDLIIPVNRPFVIEGEMWRLIDNGMPGRYDDYRNTNTWQYTDQGLSCLTCNRVIASEDEVTGDRFTLSDFNSVEMSGLFNARIRRGDEFNVSVDGKEEYKSKYKVYVNGETLFIEYSDRKNKFWNQDISGQEVRITITMPQLHDLDVMGAGKLRITGFTQDDMNIKLTGAVLGDGDFTSDNLHIELTGASFLDLSGSGNFLEADVIGASGLRAYGYEVHHAVVEARGASMARINATERLEIQKGLTSTVTHRGNPEVINR